MFKLVVKKVGYDFDEYLVGFNLFVFSNLEDNVVVKVLVKFVKENKLLVFKVGVFENNVIDVKGVVEVVLLLNYEEVLLIFVCLFIVLL